MRFPHLWALIGVPFGLTLAGAVSLGIGCAPSLSSYPPLQGCSDDAGKCGSPSGGGVGPGAGAGGGTTTTTITGTGGLSVGELRGDVERIISPSFQGTSGTAVTGALNLSFQLGSSPQLNVPYGGADGTTFDVMNVPSGQGWVFVQDASSGANSIWPTITQLATPQISSIVVPVVDQGSFTNVASDLPSVQIQGVSMQAAQIVLILLFNGQPYSGVQVTAGSAGAIVVYDIGPGTYSDQALMTGTGGTILFFNAGVSGMTNISLTNTTLMKNYVLPVYTAAGAVTVAGFELN